MDDISKPLLAHDDVPQAEWTSTSSVTVHPVSPPASGPASIAAPGLIKSRPTGRGWESLDFSRVDSAVHEAWELNRTSWDKRGKRIERWVLLFVIGAGIGALGFLIAWASQTLQKLKFDAVDSLIDGEQAGSVGHGSAFVVFVAISIGYSLAAAVPTALIAPEAAGSGISEVKGVLNGVGLPKVLRLKTLAVKVWGTILALASGAPIGAEGPMIHIGAILASGLSQGKSATLGIDTRWSVHKHFRSDRERRDFVAAGAGAGLAAAFGAPVGGVLLLLEETASHWHRSLTWRTFFTAVVAAYAVDFLFTGVGTPNDPPTGVNQLDHPGMFSFGNFSDNNTRSWSLWELPVFMTIGATGGLLGAAFVGASRRLLRWRARTYPASAPWTPAWRVAEVAAVMAVHAVLKFSASYFVGTCTATPKFNPGSYQPVLVGFYCPPDQYNDLATLFMSPSEETVRALFHFTHKEGGRQGASPFPASHLALFFLIYSLMATLCNGLVWPSGLFIPALLAGSAYGRLWGELLSGLPGGWGAVVDPGTYSLVGAAALLSGTSRLTICLSAILLESTGNYVFSLPLMITILTGKAVGSMFNDSIYDAVIHERQWPLLEEKPPARYKHLLRAGDVMTRAPVTLPSIVPAGTLLDLLRANDHHGFPVVHPDALLSAHPRLGNLAGFMQRRHLAVLLARKVFHAALPSQPFTATSDVRADILRGRQAAVYAISVNPILAEGAGGRGTPPGGNSAEKGRSGSDIMRMRFGSSKGLNSSGGGSSVGQGVGHVGAMASLSGPLAATPSAPMPHHAITLRMPSVPSMTVESLVESAQAGGRGSGLSSSSLPASHGQAPARPLRATSRHSASGTRLDALTEAAPGEEGAGRASRQQLRSSSGALERLLRERAPTSGVGAGELAQEGVELAYSDEPLVNWTTLEEHYPRYPDIHALVLSEEERGMYVDLRPYMDIAPITVSLHAPLERAYTLFRALGLRSMLVVNDGHDVAGIISRQDLMRSALHAKAEAKAVRSEARVSVWEGLMAMVSERVSGVLQRLPLGSPSASRPASRSGFSLRGTGSAGASASSSG